eukprot:TRINITY_DN11309_c0_g2_i6.p1 TRINITY_DN11309_c0_g2~~TRINITY_DN11309_c0_g2_i6.p1  ORF type:complete len:543 (+),score=120.39 TRINITY_DN11309_c0_g2_i6:74-1630(+)
MQGSSLPLSVAVCSWNVGERRPPPGMGEWLLGDGAPPDIVAVGLQELDMSAAAIVKEATSSRHAWLDALQEHLPGYKLVGARQLVGLLLAVYTRQHLLEVCVEVVRCGKGGRGNKGAVGVSVLVRGTRICFVVAHLAAHMKHVQKRNADFARINRHLHFTPKRCAIDQHDVSFFFGDLNYRIAMDIDECIQLIEAERWQDLLERDQLRQVYKEDPEHPFAGWHDCLNVVPCFPPTYKYVPGELHYDSDIRGKRRTPAWCDRVLWRSRLPAPPWPEALGSSLCQVQAGTARLVEFRRVELLDSDHRPVVGRFTVWVAPQVLGGAGVLGAGRAVSRRSWLADQSVDYAPDITEVPVEKKGRSRSGAVKLSQTPLHPPALRTPQTADWMAYDSDGDSSDSSSEEGSTNSSQQGLADRSFMDFGALDFTPSQLSAAAGHRCPHPMSPRTLRRRRRPLTPPPRPISASVPPIAGAPDVALKPRSYTPPMMGVRRFPKRAIVRIPVEARGRRATASPSGVWGRV